jgi:hypothetical protein
MVMLRDSSGAQITYCVSRRMSLFDLFCPNMVHGSILLSHRYIPMCDIVDIAVHHVSSTRERKRKSEYVSLGRRNAQEHRDVMYQKNAEREQCSKAPICSRKVLLAGL